MSSPLDVLKATRASIVQYGWDQGRYTKYDEKGVERPSCLIGHLNRLEGIPPTNREVGLAYLVLERQAGIYTRGTLETWNDAPGRTKDDVLALLDKAIRAES